MNYMKIFLLIFLILPATVFARFANVDLTGKELLMELKMTGPSTTPPGVYAYDLEKNDLKIVMPFATNPKWSPDHKKIAFYMENEFFILDIASKQYDKIKVNNDSYYSFTPVSNSFYWIDNDKLLSLSEVRNLSFIDPNFIKDKFKMDNYLSYQFLKKEVDRFCYVSNEGNAILNLTDIDGQFSNQLSYDYKTLLYSDAIQEKKDNNLLSSSILIGRIGWNNFEIIPQGDDELCYHPVLQPGGHLIAYESFSRKTGLIDAKVYDFFEKKSEYLVDRTKINFYKDEDSYRNKRKPDYLIFGWSPDGSKILYGTRNYSTVQVDGYVSYFVMNINDKSVKRIDSLKDTINPVWSSDGIKIAGIKVQYQNNSQIRDNSTVNIISFDDLGNQNLKQIKHFFLPDSKFKNMKPVNLNW